jgi:hypothetical protein
LNNNIKFIKEFWGIFIEDIYKKINHMYDGEIFNDNFKNIKYTLKSLIDINTKTSYDLKEILKSVINLTNTNKNIPSKEDLNTLFHLRATILLHDIVDSMFDYLSRIKVYDEMLSENDINIIRIKKRIKEVLRNYKKDLNIFSKHTLSSCILPRIR